ncbi:MAG: curli assembly protein CsgF [Bacteroidales bacterium]|nr:curli assembly protein CsgF [Bacteroidales bacterium]
MKNSKLIVTYLLFFFLPLSGILAQDFVYKPINPAFGGDTFNYQWLLSSAESQNKITEKSDDRYSYFDDPLQDFEATLNRQILDQLSRKIIGEQFGEGTLEAGEYMIGDYQIEIADGYDGINISIFDSSTGGQTSITIPYF